MPNCLSCGHENAPGARFCTACGVRQDACCPVCQAAIIPAQNFCSGCGSALRNSAAAGAEVGRLPVNYTPAHLAQRILASRSAIHGEIKQVTVLFCDIVGSTALAVTLGAEGMHGLLSEFFRVALAEVHRFEGTVNQFLGDGFMAIFGAPLAYEDHAARAARAALGIRRAVVSRNDSPMVGWASLQLRMGLNSGQVVVGAIGDDLRMDYTASGDTTHLAARLQALAAPGEIICGETTITAGKGVLMSAALMPVLVKGIALPVSHFRLCGVDEAAVAAVRRRSRFVGRNSELAMLRAAFARAAASAGGVLEIEGEAGVGKSRLIAEFGDELQAMTRVVSGHCVAYGRQAPNAPVVELVRGLCGVVAGDSDDLAQRAITATLAPAGEADAILLGALIGLPEAMASIATLDPATVRGRTIQAMLRVVALQSATAPLVIMIEDLHWADASSLEFLSALAVHSVKSQCLVVVTFRPGSEPPWSVQWRLERLRLAPLSAADARQLIQSLDGLVDMLGPTLTKVLARAEGNPFFLEELVRAAAHGSEQVPGDVVDVLTARIDRLEAEAKDLLRVGAVIGREFSLDLVEEVVGFAERARPHVEQLVARGFIEPVLGQRRCRFVHALTQEVSYSAMLSSDRKRLHTAVAERLAQRVSGSELASDDIARHFLLGVTPVRALPFLDVSIERAIRNHALEAAHEFFLEALRLHEAEAAEQDNLAQRVALLLRQFPVFHFTHRHAEYGALVERYLPLVDGLDLPPLRGAFLAQRGHRLWVKGDYALAVASLNEAVEICAAVGDAASGAHAHCMLAWTYAFMGRCEEAQAHGQAACVLLLECPVPMLKTFTQAGLTLAYAFRGRWHDALTAGEAARQAGIDAQDDGLASFGGAFWSFAAVASGDVEHGRALAERALAEAPTDYFRGWASAYLAAALTRSGAVGRALPILEQAVSLARESSHHSGYVKIALGLVEARLTAGDVGGAQALAEQLRAEAAAVPFVVGGCDQILGEIALAGGHIEPALARFAAAGATFAAIHAEDAWCQVEFARGRALAACGERDAARAAMECALAGFERLGTAGASQRVRDALEALCGTTPA